MNGLGQAALTFRPYFIFRGMLAELLSYWQVMITKFGLVKVSANMGNDVSAICLR